MLHQMWHINESYEESTNWIDLGSVVEHLPVCGKIEFQSLAQRITRSKPETEP